MPRQSKRSKKNPQDHQQFPLSVTRNTDYNLSEILDWIRDFCGKSAVSYKEYSRHTIFFFENLDDAFQFRMRWDAPLKEIKDK